MRKTAFILLTLLLTGLPAADTIAQTFNPDTLHAGFADAERLFMERSLPLLAARADIEASKGAVIQARLFENPQLSLEQNIYNPNNGRFSDVSRSGQNIVQLQQLFYLAGKRNKRVQVEQLNSLLTEYAYYDLLRTLRYELHSSFIQVHYLSEQYTLFQKRSQSVRQLTDAMEGQYQKGNVALKEVTRLKALLLSLESQKLDMQNQLNELQTNLRLLTGTGAGTFILPKLDESRLEQLKSSGFTYVALLQEARQNRIDLRAAATEVERQKAQVTYQKALAVPDISVGGVYDRAGSFVQNYTGLSVQVPLPLWNRNQGNIKTAKSELERSQRLHEQQQLIVENEVMQALQTAQQADALYSHFDHSFAGEYERLLDGVTQSFAKRNISLIEFLDHYESYTESMTQLLHLKSNRLKALAGLNYTVGKSLINF